MAVKCDAGLIACEPSGGNFGCHHFRFVHRFHFVSWRDLLLGLALPLCPNVLDPVLVVGNFEGMGGVM